MVRRSELARSDIGVPVFMAETADCESAYEMLAGRVAAAPSGMADAGGASAGDTSVGGMLGGLGGLFGGVGKRESAAQAMLKSAAQHSWLLDSARFTAPNSTTVGHTVHRR